MPTLYRLYRPQTFADFVGQETARRVLQNSLIHARTVNSYLFAGPRGTGKTSMARIFAKALNCAQFDATSGEVCNTCANCQSITEGSFVDLVEIDAASNRGIDEIRNIRESVRYVPSQRDGAKVYIIDEAHMLTKDASNALLKTLEEPPPGVYLILVTTDPEKLLPTIHSRVQELPFYPLSHDQLKTKLERILSSEGLSTDEDVLEQIIAQAEGGARNAESILGQLLSASSQSHITAAIAEPIIGQNTKQEAYHLLRLIGNGDLSESLRYVNTLYTQGVALEPFIQTCIAVARQLLLARISSELLSKNTLADDRETILSLCSVFSASFLDTLLRELREAKSYIHTSLTPQLPLELVLTRVLSESTSPSQTPPTSSPEPSNSEPQPDSVTPQSNTASSDISSGNGQPKQNSSSSSEDNPGSNISSDTSSISHSLPRIQKHIEENHTSLAPLFERCRISSETEDGVVFIAPSQFQKRKLTQYQEPIENAIEHITGHNIRVQFIIEQNQPSHSEEQTQDRSSSSSYTPKTSGTESHTSEPHSSTPDVTLEDSSPESNQTLETADDVEKAAHNLFQKSE